MLKLIPQENQHGRNSRKNQTIHAVTVKPEHLHLKSTYATLVRYLKKTESTTIEDLGDLIHSLQRSVITLEKKRVSLMRKNKKS